MNFNKAQLGAIEHKDGAMLVLAGPGSGKTAVITHRTKNLITKHHVKPSEILVITFTKAAADEMKERFNSLMKDERVNVSFGTFHAVFFTILKYAYRFTSANIADESVRYGFIREILSYYRLEYKDENEFIGNLLAEISLIKNSRIDIENFYSGVCGEEIFRDIYKKYETRLKENRLIDFDDMLSYTYELFKERPDILALWQNKYKYILIDEFQDTSRMQWENFHLLLQESLAQKEGSLIVGDIKQSIYRWRSGDWKILAGLGNDRSFRIKECTLDTNWRSEARIIRFNNEFFTAACQTLNRRYQEEQGKPCYKLDQANSAVRQRCAKKEEKGFVKVTFLQDSKERPYTEATLKQLAEEVERLTAEGIRLTEMAIQVRPPRRPPAPAAYFDDHTPYRIVSDEAFRLSASLAVSMLIDGLRYLSSPDDRIALARLAVAYQQGVLHKDISLNTVLLDDPVRYLPAAFQLQANALRFMPLYELLEKLFVLFDMQLIEKQDAYLCAFYDAVTEYMQNNSSELTAFIRFWDEKLNAKTIPSGEIDGIRILSIHKSKGLEYHTVLLPFCDWKMENETNNHLIWCSVAGTGKETDIPPFNRLDFVPVNYSGAMAESVYHDDYLEEKLQLWVDNLNLLYVAFTRACKNLIIFAKAGQKGTVSELLYDSLPLMQEVELPLAQENPEDVAVGEYG